MNRKKAGLIILISFVVLIAVPNVNAGEVTFQPSEMENIGFVYNQNQYRFDLTYKGYYLRLKPFAIYDGKYYELKEIIPWLRNNYPNVDYRTAVQKFKNYHRWGYWLEKLPQNVADNLDYLGFKLDYNIPLNKIRIENVEILNFSTKRIHIFEKITLDFYELYERGFEVELNKTTMLISNVKGKTDLDLDPVTYSGNLITIRGYTEAVPCTLETIYQADLAGGWNVVSNNNGSGAQYEINARVRVGDDVNETWFTILQDHAYFRPTLTAHGQYYIQVETYAHFTCGELVELENKVTRNGATIRFEGSPPYWGWSIVGSGGFTYLYDTRLSSTSSVTNMYLSTASRVWGCQMTYMDYQLQGDTYNCVFNGMYMLRAMGGSTEDIDYYSSSRILGFYWSPTCTLRNLKGYTTVVEAIYAQAVDGKVLTMIDCILNNWRITWQVNSTGVIFRKYSLNLNVTTKEGQPIPNADVILTWTGQGGGSIETTTDADGIISEQILTKGFYNETGDDTLYDYGEYNITISRAGFFTYTNLFNISEAMNYRISLRLETDGLIINTVFDSTLIVLIGVTLVFQIISLFTDSLTIGLSSVFICFVGWIVCMGYFMLENTSYLYIGWFFFLLAIANLIFAIYASFQAMNVYRNRRRGIRED